MSDAGGTIASVSAGLAVMMGAAATLLSNRRTQDSDELTKLRRENGNLRSDVLTLQNYLYQAGLDLGKQGFTLPPLPHLKSEDLE